ncbi:DUF5606 domain-containing protein [Adhaeribacter sp. BT258]|uniref:DUF5606 domain-containing protein n=1 Tax=Adhaeribacter terrigena TaxID=2793070 RepID=A0ABS1BYU2_9BACT|nr:DUF5606 domain-containing protein [Adhaeribacter terrigena]MBK0402096.1 DUF5606 domain-containing protein [Adhaeribacter terrigena]
MPVDLREIASISGMPGLYRILSPTRSGVIIETLADNPVRSAAQAKHRISLLHEISIYTNDPDVTVPLTDIFDNINQQFGENIPVNAKSSSQELTAFMEKILPDYDRERVYMSDIKKIASWYLLVKKHLTFTEAAAQPEAEEKPAKKTKAKAEKVEAGEEEAKAEAKPKKTKKSAE